MKLDIILKVAGVKPLAFLWLGVIAGMMGKGEALGSFRGIDNASEAQAALGDGIVFNTSWLMREHSADDLRTLPEALSPPSFVKVYIYEQSVDCKKANSTSCENLAELGRKAAEIIDTNMSKSGAMLFRNLPIKNALEFKRFFEAAEWPTVEYVAYGADRPKLEGIDLTTDIPNQYAIGIHNEMAYSPNPMGKIAFFCIQPAEVGGETILARNKEFTAILPQEMLDYLREAGGVLYTRRHFDANGSTGPDFSQRRFSSWQHKCRKTSKEEAMAYFVDLGFERRDMQFDMEGTLTIRFQHPGFIKHEDSKDVWFNAINSGLFTTPDDRPFPSEFLDELELYSWQSTSAVKLQRGDWLVLDNKQVLHGRLPYSKEGPTRQLLTVYSA